MKLPVGNGHVLYYEVHGLQTSNKVAIVLHGGPGGGLQRSQLKHFDLSKWRVVLFDQRGCGRSTPFLSVHNNTTWDLVADMEKLRVHLGIDKWLVFGGSWGSTLALAYASRHPAPVAGLLLRGVCLMEPWEQRWLYEEGGASRIFPEAWPAFVAGAQKSKGRGTLSQRYGRLLSNRKTRKAAAKAWWNWESAISYLEPKPDHSSPKQVESLAVLENHYFRHNAWLKPGFLLAAAAKMRIPTVIVQGRYDLVCPIASAYALRKAMPHSVLIVAKKAGHAGSETPTAYALRKMTDAFARLL